MSSWQVLAQTIAIGVTSDDHLARRVSRMKANQWNGQMVCPLLPHRPANRFTVETTPVELLLAAGATAPVGAYPFDLVSQLWPAVRYLGAVDPGGSGPFRIDPRIEMSGRFRERLRTNLAETLGTAFGATLVSQLLLPGRSTQILDFDVLDSSYEWKSGWSPHSRPDLLADDRGGSRAILETKGTLALNRHGPMMAAGAKQLDGSLTQHRSPLSTARYVAAASGFASRVGMTGYLLRVPDFDDPSDITELDRLLGAAWRDAEPARFEDGDDRWGPDDDGRRARAADGFDDFYDFDDLDRVPAAGFRPRNRSERSEPPIVASLARFVAAPNTGRPHRDTSEADIARVERVHLVDRDIPCEGQVVRIDSERSMFVGLTADSYAWLQEQVARPPRARAAEAPTTEVARLPSVAGEDRPGRTLVSNGAGEITAISEHGQVLSILRDSATGRG